MCCTHVQCSDSEYLVSCSIELVINWWWFPVPCPLFLGRRGRHLSLESLVTTSQVATKVGSPEGSVAQFQFTTYAASYHGGCDGGAVGAIRPGGRIHCSILGKGGAVLRSKRDQGRQASSSIPECDRLGELLSFTKYLIATETRGAVLKKLMDVPRNYHEPKKVVMAARFTFHQRLQQPGESVAMYLAELRKLAVPCEFGESLDEALRDRLVCGLRDEAYQKRLLSECELTLDKALQIAQSLETADVNARALRGSESGIHQMYKGGSRSSPPGKSQKGNQAPAPGQQGRECYRCGSPDHIASRCRFASFVCRKCQKKGHLARVCCSSKPASRQGTGKVDAKTHQITSASEHTEDEVPLLQLGKGQAAPITVDVTVNDVPVTMEVDTGAAVSVMSQQQQRKLFPQARLHPSQVVLRTYTAEKVAVVVFCQFVWFTRARSTTCHWSSCKAMVLRYLGESGWQRSIFHGSPLRSHSGQQEVGRSAAAVQRGVS